MYTEADAIAEAWAYTLFSQIWETICGHFNKGKTWLNWEKILKKGESLAEAGEAAVYEKFALKNKLKNKDKKSPEVQFEWEVGT